MLNHVSPDPITVLLPCKNQRKEYFLDAVASVVRQTSPDWRLLVLTDPFSPPEINEWAKSFCDSRVVVLQSRETGFARALNLGLREAATAFVSILLSDDRYTPDAVATLQLYRERFEHADFFHSARRHIDWNGERYGDDMPSREKVELEYFRSRGSPVKHLMCWRREMALALGGMDEALSAHGCDDYDFPWRMAEAGAEFQSVSECLYEYRLHHRHERLTTATPVEKQIAILRLMFERHGVPPAETDRYIQRAIDGYLTLEATDQVDCDRGARIEVQCFRDAGPDAKTSFHQAGILNRHFFPHRVFCLPKGGPDGMMLAERMAGVKDPSRMRELVLYALPPAANALPDHLNFDDDLQWHQQQFGLPAQIAAANLLIEDSGVRCYLMISDIVQRISRAPEHRTRVDNVFKGWPQLLLNAVLHYARENRLPTVYVAASEFVLRHTDPKRHPKPQLYQRIYDRVPQQLGACREGDWWRLDIARLEGRIASLERGFAVQPWPKTVCIVHDIEEGRGHRDTHPAFAEVADRESAAALTEMLAIEQRLGVKATYSVLGLLYPALQTQIRRGGHALAFHSYDHSIATGQGDDDGEDQLWKCRRVDYRLKGYRPPQSKVPGGLSAANLTHYNFEWFASSRYSLGFAGPRMASGIVWIPIHDDDYAIFTGNLDYPQWEEKMLELVASRDFVAIGLHDCYGHLWLPRYEEFLRRLMAVATLTSMDSVAAGVTLGRSRWYEAK